MQETNLEISDVARADLLLGIIKAGRQQDQAAFVRAAETLIAEERQKQHHVLADRLAAALHATNGNGAPKPRSLLAADDLVVEADPERSLDDLVLSDQNLAVCREVVEEQQRRALLQSYGLEPRNRVLLIGSPGNGKTSLAEALAHDLAVPLLTVRYESVIGSFLGETSSRIERLFRYARSRHCVLFLDEFETLGKERGDTKETGEIKRVVSTLLLQVDSLPSHVVIVAATNHHELLDRAVWRRFQIRLTMPPPTRRQLERFFIVWEDQSRLGLGLAPRTLSDAMIGASFSEAEQFAMDIHRRYVLDLPNADIRKIAKSRLDQWRRRGASGPTKT